MKNKYRILIVEDDEVIARSIQKLMEDWGWEACCVEDFSKVLDTFASYNPHLVILDIALPACNGFYWCMEIRKTSKVPIIFISSADDNMNIVMAMNIGADDFISKPFDLQVLTAKIQAVLRRSYGTALSIHKLECGKVELNLDTTTASVDGSQMELTKNEFLILKTLMEHAGSVVSRETIMERLWGNDEFVDDNTLTVNMTRIRRKMEAAGVKDFIVTKRGLGYIVGE